MRRERKSSPAAHLLLSPAGPAPLPHAYLLRCSTSPLSAYRSARRREPELTDIKGSRPCAPILPVRPLGFPPPSSFPPRAAISLPPLCFPFFSKNREQPGASSLFAWLEATTVYSVMSIFFPDVAFVDSDHYGAA